MKGVVAVRYLCASLPVPVGRPLPNTTEGPPPSQLSSVYPPERKEGVFTIGLTLAQVPPTASSIVPHHRLSIVYHVSSSLKTKFLISSILNGISFVYYVPYR
jgi:hypothetical protein